MHDLAYELPRILIPRSWVNKGKKGRGLCDVPRLDQGRTHAARSRCVAVIFRAGHDAVLDSTLDKQRSEKGAIERCFMPSFSGS
jgi:hypothetical protein